ncbi:MAG TPA: CvpA family protein [Firmicutes bacterium]|nr:CvpA family protein [Bacillota bacterium]
MNALNASNYLDLAVAAFVVFQISRGYAEGLVRSVLGLMGGILIFLAAYRYTPILASKFTGNPGIMAGIVQFLNGVVPGASAPALTGGIRSSLVNSIALMLVNLLSFLVILVAGRAVISLVGLTLHRLVGSLGGGGADRSLGALLGGVKGLCWVVIASAVFILLARLGILAVPPTVASSVFFKGSRKAAEFLVGLLLDNLNLQATSL